MAWKQPTQDDFFATLDAEEAALFARNENDDRTPIDLRV